jgi:hypothetical protein
MPNRHAESLVTPPRAVKAHLHPFDGHQVRLSIGGPPPKTGHIHVHVEDCYGSDQPVSLPVKRRDGTTVVREISPIIYAKGRPMGDTLGLLPFIYQFIGRVRVTGSFSRLVPPLCDGVEFNPERNGQGAHYYISAPISAGFLTERGVRLHMMQTPFAQHGWPVPALPLVLPLVTAPCGLEPGIVIAPFTLHDFTLHDADAREFQALKFWPHERWVAVIEAFRARGYVGPVYVLGAGTDDASPYVAAGIEPVLDRPLPQVLDLLKKAQLFLSVDTGTSHLAQLGGCQRHVLLYPSTLRPLWAEAPMGLMARGATPRDIRPDAVVDLALWVLSRGERHHAG